VKLCIFSLVLPSFSYTLISASMLLLQWGNQPSGHKLLFTQILPMFMPCLMSHSHLDRFQPLLLCHKGQLESLIFWFLNEGECILGKHLRAGLINATNLVIHMLFPKYPIWPELSCAIFCYDGPTYPTTVPHLLYEF